MPSLDFPYQPQTPFGDPKPGVPTLMSTESIRCRWCGQNFPTLLEYRIFPFQFDENFTRATILKRSRRGPSEQQFLELRTIASEKHRSRRNAERERESFSSSSAQQGAVLRSTPQLCFYLPPSFIHLFITPIENVGRFLESSLHVRLSHLRWDRLLS